MVTMQIKFMTLTYYDFEIKKMEINNNQITKLSIKRMQKNQKFSNIYFIRHGENHEYKINL